MIAMSKTNKYYTMYEWGIFESHRITREREAHVSLIQCQNIDFTKSVVETFLNQVFLDENSFERFEAETELSIKAQQLNAMKNFLGIEVGEVVEVHEADNFTSYLAVRFSDGSYLGVQMVLNDADYDPYDRAFSGDLMISTVSVESIPNFQTLPCPSSPDAMSAFSEHLLARLDFTTRQSSRLAHSGKFEYELLGMASQTKASMLVSISSDWEKVQSSDLTLDEFVASIHDRKERCEQEYAKLDNPFPLDPVVIEYGQKVEILNWVLSYFESC